MDRQQEISDLIQEREGFLKTYHDSWDDNEGDFGDYTMEEPKEIDEIGEKILKGLKKHRDQLQVDFIIESLTMLGDAPQLIYDDNGHFAVTGSGFAPVPMTDSGKFEEDEQFMSVVGPEQWKDTIREALNHYLDD